MERNLRRYLALFIAVIMAMTFFVACTPDDDPPASVSPSDSSEPSPTDSETPETPAGDDAPTRDFVQPPDGGWDVPYDRPVKVLVCAQEATNWFFHEGDDVGHNPWTRLYWDELNIEVEFEWTAVEEYETRLNMAIAAGNLPDVFHIPWDADPRLFSQLQSQGMLLDLTDAYNTYASPRIRAHETVDPYTIQGYTVDGKIYGIPRYYYGQIDQPWHMWIRKDWYEAAGSPEIKTVDDLEELAKLFMRENGASYGIGVDAEMQWLFRTAPMFDAYVGNIHNNEYFWRDDGTGRLKPGIAFPEFVTALENWARWYKDGLISPEFMTFGQDNLAQEEVVNGKVGMHAWWQWWGWWAGPTIVGLQESDDAIFLPFNMPTVDGSRPANGQIFYPNTGVTVASANFNNPAALMKIISLVDHMVFSPDADLTAEDLDLYMNEGREHAMTPVFQIIDPHADLLQFKHVVAALNSGDTSELFTTGMKSKYQDSLAWINDKEPHGLGAYLQMGFEESAYGRSQHLFDNNWTVQTAMWGPPPTEFANAGSTGDIVMEEVMAIITGSRPASDWPDILEQWYANGGQIKEDAVNLYYGG